MDATISGWGKPNVNGSVLVGMCLVFSVLPVFGSVVAAGNEHCPAAKIGTKLCKVLALHPIGRLLRRLDNT